MDCTNAMTLKTQGTANVPVNPLEIPYSSSSSALSYTTTYLNIFTHPDPTNCPVTSCTLRTSDCSAAFPSNANFYMTDGNHPYAVSAKQNIEAGWTTVGTASSTFVEFCYKCVGNKFGGGTYEFTSPGLKVRQIRNCATHIQDVGSPASDQTLLYSATTT